MSEKEYIVGGCYKVIRKLGKGGMGRVYLVQDMTNNQQYAMKVLHRHLQVNEGIIARFAREVRALRQLNHPGIVKVLDARRDGDLCYYIMDYVEGKNIYQWLKKRGQIQFASVVRVLCLVADALDHAHEITIHRDISPENIMVLADGSVRLLDFGLAKLEDANAGLTMVGRNMGKIQYNAPEQRLNAAHVDHRADIYPLGVIFYEMLTGQRPDGKHRLTQLRPDLPKGCEAFLEKAMAADPEERFQSAADFRDRLLELYELSQGMPVKKAGPLRRLLAFFAPRRLFGRKKN